MRPAQKRTLDLVCGALANYYSGLIKEGSEKNDQVIESVNAFINDVVKEDDADLLDVIETEFFENLDDVFEEAVKTFHPETIRAVRVWKSRYEKLYSTTLDS